MNNEQWEYIDFGIAYAIRSADMIHKTGRSFPKVYKFVQTQISTKEKIRRIDKQFEIGNFSILLLLNNDQETKTDLQDLCKLFFSLISSFCADFQNDEQIDSELTEEKYIHSIVWALDISMKFLIQLKFNTTTIISTEMGTGMRCFRCNSMQQFVIRKLFIEFCSSETIRTVHPKPKFETLLFIGRCCNRIYNHHTLYKAIDFCSTDSNDSVLLLLLLWKEMFCQEFSENIRISSSY